MAFQTKPQIAAGLIRETVVLGIVTLDWITADEEYGRNGEFLDEMEQLKQRYVVEVPVNTTVWTEDPAVVRPAVGRPGPGAERSEPGVGGSVAAVASALPAESWRTLQVRRGEGAACFEFAAVRVWAVRHGRGPAGLAGGAAVAGGDARGQVLRQQQG